MSTPAPQRSTPVTATTTASAEVRGELTDQVGNEVDNETGADVQAVDLREAAMAAVADAAAFYSRQLSDPRVGRPARQVLAARRLHVDAASSPADEVGYAPDAWDALYRHLRTLGYSDETLLAAGLVTRSRRGTLIDLLRHRITFTIHDLAGRPVAFTARAFAERIAADEAKGKAAGRTTPKYLNSPDTPLWCKSEVLFALGCPRVRAALADGAVPVLVEGSVDALAVTAAGRGRHVGIAPCGTALTAAHLQALEQVLVETGTSGGLAERGLVVAFDADRAGRAAAARAWTLLRERGVWPDELRLAPGADPAATWAGDPDALTGALSNAEQHPLQETLIDDAVAPFTSRMHEVESQVAAVRAAVAYLRDTPAELIGAGILRVVLATGVDADFVITEILDAPTRRNA
ncbi:toprim domain-containing protein [Kineococcus indalonis]|uniref:toprim domain-containing protein n=1 Tax=Kineococcus indalonis TaxID=2696566 RepID=UPI00141341F9|nr:toprim domain-containing protein [Kineococcus indalonis]NAZ84632.1 toprim domain-containing protein [Kineococcus indalonis]